jgi:hypothetical protein
MYGDGKPSQAAQIAARKSPVTPRATTGGSSTSPTSPRSVANLAQEYGYVFGDLKRLGVIAAALFAILVILGIVVR